MIAPLAPAHRLYTAASPAPLRDCSTRSAALWCTTARAWPAKKSAASSRARPVPASSSSSRMSLRARPASACATRRQWAAEERALVSCAVLLLLL
jgi:hypothetical protein